MTHLSKLTTTLLLLLATTLTSTAQNQHGALSAKVLDGSVGGTPIIGATVEITPRDSDQGSIYYSTGVDGGFAIPSISYGDYIIKVTYLGFEEYLSDFSIVTNITHLPDIMMNASAIEMDMVVKEIKALRASQNGDSLTYNASSFKVTSDADVEGLLQKMPGISIQDGQMTAQGEQIKKIYIDGREFFGDDVTMALKSLPAEVVDKIEVYDKKSDEAEASGVDNGDNQKSINIVTKPNMREGVFGKIFAGGGYEPTPIAEATRGKYLGGGNINIFDKNRRITVIALANNLNQQNFSFEDIMGVSDEDDSGSSLSADFMVKRLPGIADVSAVGINYSENFGEKESVKVQGSYFFNKTTTTNNAAFTRWYEAPATEDIDSLTQSNFSITENLNHRFNSRIDIKIDKRQSILIRPTLSVQSTEKQYRNDGTRYEEDKYTDYDGKQTYSSQGEQQWGGYNVSTSATYRLKLNNDRNFSAGGSIRFTDYDSESDIATDPSSTSTATEATYKYTTNPTAKRIFNANTSYLHPITKNFSLNVAAKVNNTYQTSDKKTYQTDSSYDLNDDSEHLTTNYAESNYWTHTAGAGFKYTKDKTRITGNLSYQLSTLENTTIKVNTNQGEDSNDEFNNNYNNLTYWMVANILFNKENTLRIYLNSYTSSPYISRFLDNTSSSSYITAGNPDLKPTYNNRWNIRYIRSNIENGSSLMFTFNGYVSKNYVTPHIILTPDAFNDGETTYDDVIQYTTWINLDNFWVMNANLNYGFAFDAIKSNINFSAGVGYKIIPGMYGGEVIAMGETSGGEITSTKQLSYKANVTLGSNISEKVDFTLSWWGNYNDASNATAASEAQRAKNLYFNQSASAAMKFVFAGGFTFTGNVVYKQFLGITNDYNDTYTLCNAFIGHKLLRHDRGEINVGISDILDQNTDFSRYVASTYTQNTTSYALGRYVSIQFIYNLRHFNSSNKRGGKRSNDKVNIEI